MGKNKNFNYRKAEADLFDAGARHPEEIVDYSNEKSLRKHMKEHGLKPEKYFTSSESNNHTQNNHTQNNNTQNNDSCYLTTACVESKHLPDDCVELETLRAFRDDILAHRPGGTDEIERYYHMAPGIVQKINQRADAPEIWNRVYDELVAPCVRLIHDGQHEKAFQIYKSYALELGKTYKN